MKVTLNPDKEVVKKIREQLAANGHYCPCRLVHNEDTKCMCKEFRDMIANEIPGMCHCQLYILTKED